VATNRLYSAEGLWVLEEDGRLRLGLSDFFQQRHGDIAFAELFPAGTDLAIGDDIGDIETIKVDITVNSPVSGTMLETNPSLEMEPEIINQDPYGAGWLAVVDPDNWPLEKAGLLSPEAYLEKITIEVQEEVEGK
jgi:glycine cleavage system H protein